MPKHNLPPGPPRTRAFKHVREFLANRPEFLLRRNREYGDVFRFQLGFFDIYVINRPEFIKEALMNHAEFPKTPAMNILRVVLGNGLLISKGDFHRRQRRLMQPAFHKARIQSYAQSMTRLAEDHSARWEDGKEIDISVEMMTLTLQVISETMFGAAMDDSATRVSKAMNAIIPIIDRLAQPTGIFRMVLPSPSNIRLLKARRELNRIIYGIIAERRKSGDDRDDLLGMLLSARDAEGDGSGMTDKQVRDEAMTIFLAGHETTAIALSWTIYLLAQHPDVLERVRDELDAVLDGRAPTFDDLPNLTYTRQVVTESLRLYPPAYLFDRMPKQDWDLGDYTIPKKKYVFISPYIMHRRPDFYPDPERFDPGRWAPDGGSDRPKFAYFPFGGGPRICIGEQFAWTEMILVLATLLPKWDFELLPGQEIVTEPLITLRPKYGIRFRLHERTAVPATTAV